MGFRWFYLSLSLGVALAILPQRAEAFSLREKLSIPIPQLVLKTLNDEIAGSIEVKQMRYLPPSTLLLLDVTLKDPAGKPFASIARLKATLSVSALFVGRLVVSSVEVEKPFLRLELFKSNLNLIDTFTGKTTSDGTATPTFKIQQIKVKGGGFEFATDVGVHILSRDVSAVGLIAVNKGRVQVEFKDIQTLSGAIEPAGMQYLYENLYAKSLLIDPENLETLDVRFDSMGSQIVTGGKLLLDKERFQIAGKIKAPPGVWPTGLPPLEFKTPAFHGNFQLAGAFNDPIIDVDANLESCKPYGIPVKEGVAQVNITKDKVTVSKAKFALEGGGFVYPTGFIRYTDLYSKWDAHVEDVYLNSVVSKWLKSVPVEGAITGQAHVSGSFSKGRVLQMGVEGEWAHAGINKIQIAPKTHVHAQAKLKNHRWIQDAKLELDGATTQLVGTGHLDTAKMLYDAKVDIGKMDLFQVPVRNAAVDLVGDAKGVRLNLHTTEVAKGKLEGKLDIDWSQPRLSLFGDVKADRISLAEIPSIGQAAKLQGDVSASAHIEGQAPDIKIDGLLVADGLMRERIDIGQMHAKIQLRKQFFELDDVKIRGLDVVLESTKLSWDLKTDAIAGLVDLKHLALSPLLPSEYKVAGGVAGNLRVDGKWKYPQLSGELFAQKIKIQDLLLGDGDIELKLRSALAEKESHLSLKSQLAHQKGILSIDAEVAFPSQNFDIKVDLDKIPLFAFTANNPYVSPLQGDTSGKVHVWNTSKGINIEANIQAPMVSYLSEDNEQYDAIEEKEKEYRFNPVGPAQLHFKWIDHQVDFSFKGLSNIAHHTGVDIAANGRFVSVNDYRIRIKSNLDVPNLEHFVEPLRKQLTSVDVKGVVDVEGSRAVNGNHDWNGVVHIQEGTVELASVPKMVLQKPLVFSLYKNMFKFDRTAEVLIDNTAHLQASGYFSKDDIGVNLEGEIPIGFTRLFLPVFRSGEGLVDGKIAITGSLSHLIPKGTVKPQKGSILVPRDEFDLLEFTDGSLAFSEDKNQRLVIQANHLEANVGDGKMLADGQLVLGNGLGEYVIQDADFALLTQDVRIKSKKDFADLDSEIRLQNVQDSLWLTGDIKVVAGLLSRSFSLRNFILTSEGGVSAPEIDLKPFENIQLNVDVQVQSFDVSANVVAFYADATLASELHVTGNCLAPRVVGNVEVESGGVLHFPAADLEIEPAIIPIRYVPARAFDPQVKVSAFGFLPETQLGVQDVGVELKLEGKLSELHLDLKSSAGIRGLSSVEILARLLNPSIQSSSEFSGTQGASRAATALSSQLLFSPLTSDFEQMVYQYTGTRLRTGVFVDQGRLAVQLQWQLNSRLKFEGTTSAQTTSLQLQDLKLRLLLFDHLDAGKSLYFEGNFWAPSTVSYNQLTMPLLFLRWRVVER